MMTTHREPSPLERDIALMLRRIAYHEIIATRLTTVAGGIKTSDLVTDRDCTLTEWCESAAYNAVRLMNEHAITPIEWKAT